MSPDEDGASKRATAKIDPGDASTNGIPILKNRHYTRREKEQAIEISKKLCYVNLDMASLHKVPLKTAANYLYIPQCSLRSWLKEEYQIILMPPNAKRRPPQLKSIRNPAKADSSYKSYLLMSLQMLQRIKLIRSGDIYKLHPWSHPVPFIGFDSGRRRLVRDGRSEPIGSLGDAYEFVGQHILDPHPGHPLPPPIQISTEGLEMIVGDTTEQTERMTLKAVNEWLYYHGPNYNDRRAGKLFELTKFSSNKDKLEKCVAMLCRQIFMASDEQLKSASPVRIEFDYHHPTQGITQHWAVHLQFQCGKQILLPLSLQLTGPVANDYVTDTLYLQGWTYDHRAAICKAGSRDKRSRANFAIRSFYDKSISTFDKFQHSPVLHVADVEMLFTSEQCTGWRPRRYVATWSLFTSIIHIHGNHKRSMTPLYGRYTDIRLLIRKVYETGLEVEFLSNPIGKCFEVLKLSSFTLASSRVLSQRLQKLHTVMHSDVLAENPGYLSHFVSKALHLGWHLVDNEHRCRFLSCVEKVKGLSSDYCMYHSAEIIRSIETLPDHVAVNVPDLVDLGTPEVNQEEHRLAVLNEWFKQPSKTWLIDFEFVQLRGEQSPIPLQMSIRQLDGRPVLECNIDHNVTSEKFRGALAELSTSCKNLGYQTFERCYDDIETNGLTPPQIKEHLENIGYDKNTRVLSWSSSADMQCLLVLLRGRTGLVQDKISHTTAKNFQGINLRDLCRKLFPRLPNDTLSVVHRYLGVPSDQDVPPLIRAYHSASYDTYALAQIVARLKRL